MTASEAKKMADVANSEPPFNEPVVNWLVDQLLISIRGAASRGEYRILLFGLPKLRTPVTKSDETEVRRRMEAMGYRYTAGSGPEIIEWGAE